MQLFSSPSNAVTSLFMSIDSSSHFTYKVRSLKNYFLRSVSYFIAEYIRMQNMSYRICIFGDHRYYITNLIVLHEIFNSIT